MKVAEALEIIRLVGVVESAGGKLKLKFPETARTALQPALDVLRTGKEEALALLAESQNETSASPPPAQTNIDCAGRILQAAGIRFMQLDGVATVGVWSDLDGPEARAALSTMGTGDLPVRYLDGSGIPIRYKLRHVEGDPVPLSVLRAMERATEQPWLVRDKMLAEMGMMVRSKATVPASKPRGETKR